MVCLSDLSSLIWLHPVQLELLTGASRSAFEATRVTRYEKGDHQRRHFDARDGRSADDGSANNLADASLGLDSALGPGQRLVQCLVYLNDMPPGGGGETKFFHPMLKGLQVCLAGPPQAYSCFFTSMSHLLL